MTTSFDFDPNAHLTPAQLAERWKDSPFPASLVTLARWRRAGRGPEFIRAGHSEAEKAPTRVFYPIEAVEAYESTRCYNPSTSNSES